MNNNIMFREGYCIRDQHAPHFLTFTICGWMDLFTRKVYRDIFIESLRHCRSKKDLMLHAYVIMSNHIHLIAAAGNGGTLSDLVRDIKSFTAHQILQIVESEQESRRHWMLHQLKYYGGRNSRNEKYQLWIQDNYPEELLTIEMAYVKLNYIHENPVRAGIVANPEDYLYSSASNYIKGQGLMEIDFLF